MLVPVMLIISVLIILLGIFVLIKTKNFFWFALIFYLSSVVAFFPIYWTNFDYEPNTFLRIIQAIFISMQNAGQLYTLNGGFENVKEYFDVVEYSETLKSIYRTYMTFDFIVSEAIFAQIILITLLKLFSNIKYYLSIGKDVCFFSDLSDNSVALAEDIFDNSKCKSLPNDYPELFAKLKSLKNDNSYNKINEKIPKIINEQININNEVQALISDGDDSIDKKINNDLKQFSFICLNILCKNIDIVEDGIKVIDELKKLEKIDIEYETKINKFNDLYNDTSSNINKIIEKNPYLKEYLNNELNAPLKKILSELNIDGVRTSRDLINKYKQLFNLFDDLLNYINLNNINNYNIKSNETIMKIVNNYYSDRSFIKMRINSLALDCLNEILINEPNGDHEYHYNKIITAFFKLGDELKKATALEFFINIYNDNKSYFDRQRYFSKDLINLLIQINGKIDFKVTYDNNIIINNTESNFINYEKLKVKFLILLIENKKAYQQTFYKKAKKLLIRNEKNLKQLLKLLQLVTKSTYRTQDNMNILLLDEYVNELNDLFRKKIFVFANVNFIKKENQDANLNERIKKIHALCFKRPIDEIYYKKATKRCKFYFLDENEDPNVNQAIKVINKCRENKKYNKESTEFYINFSTPKNEALFNSIDNGNMKIMLFDINRNFAIKTLIEHPIYKNNKKDLHIIIVGIGGYGFELLNNICCFGQMPNYNLKIDIFDKNIDPEVKIKNINNEIMCNNEVNDDDMPKYAIITHSGIDIRTDTFNTELNKLTLDDVTDVYVTLGNDDLNIEAAMKIRMILERNKLKTKTTNNADIYAIVYNQDKNKIINDNELLDFKQNSYNITLLGSLKENYSVENVEQRYYNRLGLEKHLQYSMAINLVEDSQKYYKYNYNRKSSIAQGIFAVLYKKYCDIDFSDSEYEKLRKKYEHLRWMMFMYFEGYIYNDIRNDIAKTHKDIKKWETLSEATQELD